MFEHLYMSTNDIVVVVFLLCTGNWIIAPVKANSHKIIKQSQTIGDGLGKLNLVQLSRSTQTVAGSLRSLRVYVNKIGDCLPILCELALTKWGNPWRDPIQTASMTMPS